METTGIIHNLLPSGRGRRHPDKHGIGGQNGGAAPKDDQPVNIEALRPRKPEFRAKTAVNRSLLPEVAVANDLDGIPASPRAGIANSASKPTVLFPFRRFSRRKSVARSSDLPFFQDGFFPLYRPDGVKPALLKGFQNSPGGGIPNPRDVNGAREDSFSRMAFPLRKGPKRMFPLAAGKLAEAPVPYISGCAGFYPVGKKTEPGVAPRF
jgi:hypothetical protein